MSESLEPRNKDSEFQKRFTDALWKTFLEEPIKKGTWFMIFAIISTLIFWSGSPSWWSTLALGFSTAFFLVAIFFTSLVIRNYRKLTTENTDLSILPKENESLEINRTNSPLEIAVEKPKELIEQSIEDIQLKPNIVFIESNIKLIGFNKDRNCFEEGFYKDNGLILKFGNEPLDSGQKVGELNSVNAQVEFYTRKGKLYHSVDYGIWLDTRASVWFNFGTRQRLLIAYRFPNQRIRIVEHKFENGKDLDDNFYRIKIRLL
jgi:hypothetical protein